MTFELLLAVYMACAGFVAAGLIGSLYQLVTGTPPKFQVRLESFPGTFVSCILCAFAGPFIIMRNAIRGRRVENRPISWLVASSTIAAMWSICTGILVLQFALSVTGSF